MARRPKVIFLAIVLAVVTSVSGVANQASADTTAQLNASQIVADMGAGWNLGNQLEANSNGDPSETACGQPTVTQALIDKVKSEGFKTIRIPVSYLNYIGSAPTYTINPSWLNRIQELVNYAYSSRANRAYLASRGIRAAIAVPADQAAHRRNRSSRGGRPPAFDPAIDRDRHAVECGINALKHKRSITTRYDKLAVRYAAMISVATIDRWLRRLT